MNVRTTYGQDVIARACVGNDVIANDVSGSNATSSSSSITTSNSRASLQQADCCLDYNRKGSVAADSVAAEINVPQLAAPDYNRQPLPKLATPNPAALDHSQLLLPSPPLPPILLRLITTMSMAMD